VSLWSDPNKTFEAKLRELAPAADAATRTYLAKFSLPDATDDMMLGMTATLTLSDPSTLRVARVPLSAIYTQGDGPALFVADDKGFVEVKPVKVVSYETRDAIISGGVQDGATVVAVGVHKLDVGQKVRVVSSLSF
jgi:RND family efflux transporter MFP subunit